MQHSAAPWKSWNPVTGCTKASAGCANCYAERFAERWRGVPGHPYEQGFELQLRPGRLDWPLRWKKPRRVFVVSMGDLFHDDVPADFIREVFTVMDRAPRHLYHLVTKRPRRALELAGELPWPATLRMGVTVEHAETAWRADVLRQLPAASKWICAEPLLGPLDPLDLSGIGWVVAGCESGPRRRACLPEWVEGLRRRCEAAGVDFRLKGRDVGAPSVRPVDQDRLF
jgi:protein gp37